MRFLLSIALAGLLLSLQYPLWVGKGSWLNVGRQREQLQQARLQIVHLKQRNAKLEAEVLDLKQGYAAIEERARSELGLIKEDELFVQILDTPPK